MTDPFILFAFVAIYLATGTGLLALAGGFRRTPAVPVPLRQTKS